MARKKSAVPVAAAKREPLVVRKGGVVSVREGFSEPHGIWMADRPTCVNGLDLRRHRVTVELVDEPHEVIVDRLRKLWEETQVNYHYTRMMREAAAALGVELLDEDRAKLAPKR